MNDNLNNQNNNFGYNPLTTGGGQNNYHTTNNNIRIVNNNPNTHKSKLQITEEIEILKKKIKNNKIKLSDLNEETKIMVENMIVEDELRINELEHELESRKSELVIIIVYSFVALIFMLIVYYIALTSIRR